MPPCVAAAQSHNQTPRVFREMAGTKHQVFNHCPQSPAANLPFGRLLVFEGFLTNHPEEVVGDHCQFQYQGIGSKLPGRKTFHIHIGFQFTVVLLGFSMRVVGSDDIII